MTSSDPTDSAGIVTKDSPRTIDDTVSKLTALIQARGMKLFAVIDQAAEARHVDLELRPTVLVVFGDPTAGTAVMEAEPLAALDLPLKVLVWVDGDRTGSRTSRPPPSPTATGSTPRSPGTSPASIP